MSPKQKRTVEEIGQRFQDLTISLNVCREELISGVQELKKEKLNTLKIQQEELELALDIVQRSVGFTEKTIKHGSEVEIYIHVERSSITDFESNDIVEMYLDNQCTRESDIWCGINRDTFT